MSSFWSTPWALVFMGAPFVLCFAGLIMSLLLTRRECFCRVMCALPRSAWVEQQRGFFTEISFKSRWHLINSISGAFLYPTFVIRRGLFDEQDVIAFPAGLRRLMVISVWFSLSGFLWLMIAVGLLTLTRTD